jgi:hypothetical protein
LLPSAPDGRPSPWLCFFLLLIVKAKKNSPVFFYGVADMFYRPIEFEPSEAFFYPISSPDLKSPTAVSSALWSDYLAPLWNCPEVYEKQIEAFLSSFEVAVRQWLDSDYQPNEPLSFIVNTYSLDGTLLGWLSLRAGSLPLTATSWTILYFPSESIEAIFYEGS